MTNLTKRFTKQNVGMNETLCATDSAGIPCKKNVIGKKQGNKIELHFHVIGELVLMKEVCEVESFLTS
jgi:hypothetical protein